MSSPNIFPGHAEGYFHPAVRLQEAPEYGLCAVAGASDLESNTQVVYCAYDFAITPKLARSVLGLHDVSDRQATAAFLLVTRDALLLKEQTQPWRAYVRSLPRPEQMYSPLFFSHAELCLLQNTNLAGAVEERVSLWKLEWEHLCTLLRSSTRLADCRISFRDYVWAATILSSRAFPSSLIHGKGGGSANKSAEGSVPVLFPGVDLLNHNPAQKVLWRRDAFGLSIVTEQPVSQGTQIFNNYGPKGNEELFLGYGFVIQGNNADTLALKLGQAPPELREKVSPILEHFGLTDNRHLMTLNGELPPALLAQLRVLLADDHEVSRVKASIDAKEPWEKALSFLGWDNELNVLDHLKMLLEAKAAALQRVCTRDAPKGLERDTLATVDAATIRPQVADMIESYRDGQIDIIGAARQMAEQRFDTAIETAEDEEDM